MGWGEGRRGRFPSKPHGGLQRFQTWVSRVSLVRGSRPPCTPTPLSPAPSASSSHFESDAPVRSVQASPPLRGTAASGKWGAPANPLCATTHRFTGLNAEATAARERVPRRHSPEGPLCCTQAGVCLATRISPLTPQGVFVGKQRVLTRPAGTNSGFTFCCVMEWEGGRGAQLASCVGHRDQGTAAPGIQAPPCRLLRGGWARGAPPSYLSTGTAGRTPKSHGTSRLDTTQAWTWLCPSRDTCTCQLYRVQSKVPGARVPAGSEA